jgi:hypothetical protein
MTPSTIFLILNDPPYGSERSYNAFWTLQADRLLVAVRHRGCRGRYMCKLLGSMRLAG